MKYWLQQDWFVPLSLNLSQRFSSNVSCCNSVSSISYITFHIMNQSFLNNKVLVCDMFQSERRQYFENILLWFIHLCAWVIKHTLGSIRRLKICVKSYFTVTLTFISTDLHLIGRNFFDYSHCHTYIVSLIIIFLPNATESGSWIMIFWWHLTCENTLGYHYIFYN